MQGIVQTPRIRVTGDDSAKLRRRNPLWPARYGLPGDECEHHRVRRSKARRKEIYEALHPETRHGGDRKSNQVDNLSTRSFAEETALATGRDARSVRRDASRGEALGEALEDIAGTSLDKGVELDALGSNLDFNHTKSNAPPAQNCAGINQAMGGLASCACAYCSRN